MKTLVTYFTAEKGLTKEIARIIAENKNADLYEIKPKVPYTKADLNWMDKKSRSTLEMKDMIRVELDNMDARVEDYDIIYVGFPIWWYKAPSIINSFLESYDFSGKKIVVYATSGSSGFGDTRKYLEESVKDCEIEMGEVYHKNYKKEKVLAWLNR